MSILHYERCPECGGVLATQTHNTITDEFSEVKRYDDEHVHTRKDGDR